jgi:hypothetical protein
MTLIELKRGIDSLRPQDQDELAAYLSHIRHRRNDAYAEELRRRLDDDKAWVRLEDFEAELAADSSA